jgi:tol-pal system protein YbgF
MIRYFSLFLTVCLMLSAFGCVTKTDVETLQLERQQDLNRIKQLEAELEESKQLLRQEIEKSQSPVREKTADTWAELQSLRSDFAKLRGSLETLNMRMDQQLGDNATLTLGSLSEELREVEFILENQLQVDMSSIHGKRLPAPATTVVVGAAADANATAQETQQPAKEKAEPAKPAKESDPAKALYDKAYALYKQGDYEKARSYWAEFTDTFKKHTYVASAVFWQGQCYYKLKDYAREAILYEDVIEKYTKSSKYKSALLMAAYSWDKLGKPELAKMRLNEVIEKFPKSPQATQAKRYLEKIK